MADFVELELENHFQDLLSMLKEEVLLSSFFNTLHFRFIVFRIFSDVSLISRLSSTMMIMISLANHSNNSQ